MVPAVIALLFSAWAQDCDLRAFDANVQRFDDAFIALDLSTFQEAVAAQRQTLSCMEDPLTPVHCVEIHRMRAIDAFVSDDLPAATMSFQALVATRPGYTLPSDIVPEGHPLQDVFKQAREYQDDSVLDLAPPAEGWLTVDGKRTLVAPSGRPWVFQQFTANGVVAQTRYVPVGAPLPSYDDGSPKPKKRHKGRAPALAIGITTVAVGQTVYASALVSRVTYNVAVSDGDKEAIDAAHRRTNGLAITSFGLMGLGVGLIGVGIAL